MSSPMPSAGRPFLPHTPKVPGLGTFIAHGDPRAKTCMDAHIVIDSATGYVLKSRTGDYDSEKILVVDTEDKEIVGPMNDRQKMYSIEWETVDRYPLWRLSSNQVLSVDITQDFDAKFRLIAYNFLSDEIAEDLRYKALEDQYDHTTREGTPRKLAKMDVTQGNTMWGYDRSIFNHFGAPGSKGCGWLVTNNAHLMPGIKTKKRLQAGSNFFQLLEPNPYDGYQVQFCQVPYDIFKRYWRKPVRLMSKWHRTYKGLFGKHHYAGSVPTMEVLEFSPQMLRQHKVIWADFSFAYQMRTRMGTDVRIVQWMLKHSPMFKPLTDEETPFAKDDHEVFFSLEWG